LQVKKSLRTDTANGFGRLQSENYVIDAEYYWVKNNELSWSDVKRLVDKPAAIWTNNHSTYDGLNDRVKIDIAARLNTSLMLIEPADLTVKDTTDWRAQRLFNRD
jgi:hypothetical protein